jgi:U4/U6.U5 tri-snRNP-associated protein 2
MLPFLHFNSGIFHISVPRKQRMKTYRLCPYLDTINRQVLDFDFEKLCSVSLSRINVYACLVCGKYFQGL